MTIKEKTSLDLEVEEQTPSKFPDYSPSKKSRQTIRRVYDDFEKMRDTMEQKYHYFNDRTIKQFIDDSELRVIGYVPDKASQGKEEWQANFYHPTTRNKLKAMLAAVALQVPKVDIVAQNERGMRDKQRAYVMRHLVDFSFNLENKEEDIFFEAWETAVKGTVIVYDGHLKTTAKKKIIKSFDALTGEIETEEKEVVVDDDCVSFIVPLENFYIKDPYMRNVQDQPAVAWVEKLNKGDFELQFGKYKDAEFVKGGTDITEHEEERFFKEDWAHRTSDDKENPIEVIRYYNRINDEFIIIANGVKLLEVPLLLGNKKKYYPFAKTIFEPFSADFFWGNSLPNTLMGEQDVINTLYNMSIDKTYKSMVTPLLVGNVNKDDFDLEDQIVTSDTKIYVQDITQVRELPIKGVSTGDVKMIDIVSKGLDLSSVDANQQGVSGRGVTAREVVIANENAQKLRGVLFMFLTSLWIQKVKLRVMNILTYYTQPKVSSILGEDGKPNKIDEYRRFMIEGAEMSDGTTGTLGVDMVGTQEELPTPQELDKSEEAVTKQGVDNYEEMAITADYLDNWRYDIKVTSDSIQQNDSTVTIAKTMEKVKLWMIAFPQLFMANQEKIFKDSITAFGEDPDEYMTGQPQLPPGQPGQEQGGEGGKPVSQEEMLAKQGNQLEGQMSGASPLPSLPPLK